MQVHRRRNGGKLLFLLFLHGSDALVLCSFLEFFIIRQFDVHRVLGQAVRADEEVAVIPHLLVAAERRAGEGFVERAKGHREGVLPVRVFLVGDVLRRVVQSGGLFGGARKEIRVGRALHRQGQGALPLFDREVGLFDLEHGRATLDRDPVSPVVHIREGDGLHALDTDFFHSRHVGF